MSGAAGLKAAIEAAGGVRALARLLKITHQAIGQWEQVPLERVLDVERVTGIARETLRPEFFRSNPRQTKRSSTASC